MIINFNKFRAIGLGLMQFALYSRKLSLIRRGITSSKVHFNNDLRFKLFIGLAFLWPVTKKEVKTQNESNNKSKQSVLIKADILFENGHYDECYKILDESTPRQSNEEVEIQWRLCRVLYNMSKEPHYDNNSKREFIDKAYQIISEQIEKNYNHFAVQKWYALLLDAKSSRDGIRERIKQLENVKKHMDLAVTINPNDATTLHMLGEWCYQVSSMPWHQRKIAEAFFAKLPQSTYEDALEYFLRAETVQPRFYSLNLLRIGMCYLKLNKEDQAKYYLQLAAVYPAKSNDDHQANKDAAELLKRLNY